MKLDEWMNSLVGLLVVLGGLLVIGDLFIMVQFHDWLVPAVLSEAVWEYADPFLLLLFIFPLFYFLIYRRMQRDLESRQRMITELNTLRQNLESQVADRTRELAESRDAAEAANLDKSRFLGEISHEIRTPMNAIIGWNYLLQRKISDPELQEKLYKVGEAANHLLKVINHMFDLARIESGQYMLEEMDFVLVDMLDQLAANFDKILEEKGLTLSVQVDTEIPVQLHGDPLRLAQILANFIGNAIRYSERGNIALRFSLDSEQASRVMLRIEVEDQGIGLTESQLQNLFRKYTKTEGNQQRHMGSTGLGLIITKQLVAMMGGEVGVTSRLGEGSTFWMTAAFGKVMPKNRLAGPARTLMQDEPLEVLKLQYSGARVLIVEDDSFNQEMLQEVIGAAGLITELASDGSKAVDMVKHNDYAIVVMDVQMPVMNGLEATRQIRLLSGKGNLPIFAMTANVSTEDRVACLEAGMNDYLSKPVDPDMLYSVMLFWLRKSGRSSAL